MNNRTGRAAVDDTAAATHTRYEQNERTAGAELRHGFAAELADAKRALAESRRQIHALTRQVARLQQTNAHLEQAAKDLAEREAQARVHACQDDLTGLPNRRELSNRLRQAMAHGARHKRQLALILLDLDDFKTINDQLGHGVGDQVLCLVAARLLGATRDADTACRYGGDEFVILLPEIGDIRVVDMIVSKLQTALGEPYRVDGFDIRMTASAGRVIYPDDGAGGDALMAMADHALYRAKIVHRKVSITNRGAESAAPRVAPAHTLRAL